GRRSRLAAFRAAGHREPREIVPARGAASGGAAASGASAVRRPAEHPGDCRAAGKNGGRDQAIAVEGAGTFAGADGEWPCLSAPSVNKWTRPYRPCWYRCGRVQSETLAPALLFSCPLPRSCATFRAKVSESP